MKNRLYTSYARMVSRLRNALTPSLKHSALSEEHLNRIETYRPFLDPADFRKARVLDIGCGDGALSFQALVWKAREVCGVELDRDKFIQASDFSKIQKTGFRSIFIRDDAQRFSFWNMIGPFDVALCLPLFPSMDRMERCSILARVAAHTGRIMYTSGAPDEPVHEVLEQILAFTDFTSVEYRGSRAGDKSAHEPVFRLSRSVLTQKKAAEKIYSWMQDGTFSKIAVVGKNGSGKSVIRKQLETIIQGEQGYEIIDDCSDRDYLNSLEKTVLFDCRALEYVDDFEAVIFVHTDERIRRNDIFLSSPGRFILQKWLGFRILPEKLSRHLSPGGSIRHIREVRTAAR